MATYVHNKACSLLCGWTRASVLILLHAHATGVSAQWQTTHRAHGKSVAYALPQVVVELSVDPAAARAPQPPPGDVAGASSATSRVRFATLAPDRTPAAEAALRRAREEGPMRRRRRADQMPVHEVRP